MRPGIAVSLALFALLTVSCGAPSVKGYWERHKPDISDISAAEDEFAAFAELAVAAPGQDAEAEIDRLFDLLKADEVAYYVYTEWVVRAFYASSSPCRNCPLFVYSMKRVLSDGIVDGYDAELYSRFVTSCLTNHVGDPLKLPSLSDRLGNSVTIELGQPILFLVVDLSCPSCLKALEKQAGEHPEARHVALCSGFGSFPKIEGWEYYRAHDTESVYDHTAAPFYFIADADGVIIETYTRCL
ncbi:MAG: DUF5106 domain-containing protein [Bacteroidales bacterium]|nr:DUF5106 domain-containing protein [Bacteroidales bacterium]